MENGSEINRREGQKEEAQRKIDALVDRLPNLDFSNQEAVLDWICEFQDPSDHIGVVKDQQKILETFAEHGYQPSVNTGEALDRENSNNVARYIIGQALDGLQDDAGAIRHVIHKLTDDWKKKFAS